MTEEKVYDVAIIEDDRVLGSMLQENVSSISGFRCSQLFTSVKDFFEAKPEFQILLLDVNLKDENGIQAIEPILEIYPDAAIVMNTIRDDADTIFEALKRGAVGYLDKQTIGVNLEDVLKTVSDGGAFMTPRIARKIRDTYFTSHRTYLSLLTDRERDVTNGIVEGLSYKLIADRYGIAINTVRMYVKKIYKKLRVHNRSELGKVIRN